MNALDLIDYVYQDTIVPVKFRTAQMNQMRQRIRNDVNFLRNDLKTVIKPKYSEDEVHIEHPYELSRALANFSLLSTEQLRSFNDGFDKLEKIEDNV